MIDTKGLNMNLVRLLAQSRVVGGKELPAIVNYARSITKLACDNPGEVFPEPLEDTLGLWRTIAILADEAGQPKLPSAAMRWCGNCRFRYEEYGQCVVDPPEDKPRQCKVERPACSRWEAKS